MIDFLVIPFILLGAFALLVVWLLSRMAKVTPKSPPEQSTTAHYIWLIFLGTIIGVIGLVVRLYGINNSLWLDEFGTLWTIEGDLLEVVRRAFSFQGQSPFYYLTVWACVRLLGTSEITLRLPSLLFGVATIYTAYRLANEVYGRNAGLITACFLWIAPAMTQTSVDARPYALALLMAAIMFYGFARATQTGSRNGRWLFITGAVGLFSAHYLLIPVAMGVAIGYICFPILREKYPSTRFARDVGIQLFLGVWCLPQIGQLLGNHERLSWLGAANHLAFFELIGPFIVWTFAGFFFRPRSPGLQQAITWVFLLAVAAQIGFLELLQFFGINLLHQRYLLVILIPAALVAAVSLRSIPRYVLGVPVAYWLIFISVSFLMEFKAHGSFSRVGFQDWRYAVRCVQNLVRDDPKAIVLYRSGFVEEDDRVNGKNPSTVTLSPLLSPGKQPVSWNLIPLTYSWAKPGRDKYFSKTVEPAVRNASVVYFLTCAHCFNETTGNYPESLLTWIEERFPQQFVSEVVQAGRGITLIQFTNQAGDSRPASRFGGSYSSHGGELSSTEKTRAVIHSSSTPVRNHCDPSVP
jgi:Dolichyl-phosphate-mannose-protein mannosyltransferase